MSKSRHIILVTLVATALCADRVVSAMPSLQPQVVELAGRLATRLSKRFVRVVPAATLFQSERFVSGVRVGRREIPADSVCLT